MKQLYRDCNDDWPNWSINFPFVATKGATGDGLKLHRGDRGIIRLIGQKSGNIGVVITERANGQKCEAHGWVPKSCIQPGQGFPVTVEPYCDVVEPPVELPDSPCLEGSGSSVLAKTISGSLSAYHDIHKELPTVPRYLDGLLDSKDKVRQFTNKILVGIGKVNNGNLRRVLESNNFNIWDLRNASEDVQYNHRSGVYLQMYWELEGEPDGRTADIYIGSAANLQSGTTKAVATIFQRNFQVSTGNK